MQRLEMELEHCTDLVTLNHIQTTQLPEVLTYHERVKVDKLIRDKFDDILSIELDSSEAWILGLEDKYKNQCSFVNKDFQLDLKIIQIRRINVSNMLMLATGTEHCYRGRILEESLLKWEHKLKALSNSGINGVRRPLKRYSWFYPVMCGYGRSIN